jgi:hypothetical protein
MKHFATEQWIDFVNQTGSREKQREMQTHLNSGCKRCAKALSLWQKVQHAAAQEANFQPPEDTVRSVKSAYQPVGYRANKKFSGIVAELLFDSFLQPATVGTRSATLGARQMLYRAGTYQVDVQIEAKPDESRLSVTGQLMDVSRPEIVRTDVPVTLSNRRGHVVRTATNQFGEFRGEVEDLGDLELRIAGPDEKEIVISLRDALVRSPRGLRGA